MTNTSTAPRCFSGRGHLSQLGFFLAALLILGACSARKTAQSGTASGSTASTGPVTSAQAANGHIVYFEAPLNLTRNGSSLDVSFGQELLVGDILTTGSNGTCELELPGVGILKLSYSTQLRLDGFRPDEQRAAVSIIKGSLLSKIDKLIQPDAFVVRSNSTVCGVRGTIFSVETGENGNLVLDVLEGTVSIFPDSFLTEGIHPAAELIAQPGQDSNKTASINFDDLPTVTAGESLSMPAKTFASKEILEGSQNAKADPGQGTSLIKTLRKKLPSVQPLPASRKKSMKAFATASKVTRAEQSYMPEIKEATFTVSSLPIEAPSTREESGNYWPRPHTYRSKPATKKVIAPLSEATAFMVLNPQTVATTKASFAEGRGFIESSLQTPDRWTAILELLQKVKLETNRLYTIEYTAWSQTDSGSIMTSLCEANRDLNKDGSPYSSYTPRQTIRVNKEPRRYSQVYHHVAETDDAAALNFQFGVEPGTVYIQDITFKEIPGNPIDAQTVRLTQIPNGDFSRGFLYWSVTNIESFDPLLFSIEDGSAVYKADIRMTSTWHTQMESNVTIKKGQTYQLFFDAKIEGEGFLNIALMENGIDINKGGTQWSLESPGMRAELTSKEWTRFRIEFKSLATDPRARLLLDFGNLKGKVYLDNFVMEEKN